MNYAVMYEFAVDTKSSQFKAPLNKINNQHRVATNKDTAVITLLFVRSRTPLAPLDTVRALSPGRGRQSSAQGFTFSTAGGDTSRGTLRILAISLVARRVARPRPGKKSWPASAETTRLRTPKS
jgi:hypothetical protein